MQTGNRTWWRAGVVVFAVGAALAPVPSNAVDRWYSGHMYASIQPLLTSMSNLVPFSLLDALIAAVTLAWLVLAGRDLRITASRLRAAVLIAVRTVVWAAAFYLLFVALWGLNYRRPPMRETLPYDSSAVTAGAAAAAGRIADERMPCTIGRMRSGGRRLAKSMRTWLTASHVRCARPASSATSCRRDPSTRCSTGTSGARALTA